MLDEVARELDLGSRFRVWSAWAGAAPVCTQLFVVAGGELAYWNGGFAESWGRFSPGLVTVLAAVEDGFRRAEHRVDFGGGADGYKRRFADGSDPVVWTTLYARRATYPAARAIAMPRQARRRARTVAGRWLAPEARWRLKRLVDGRGPR